MGQPQALTIFGVASPYAWDVVESAQRLGLEFVAIDNLGTADPRLPGLTTDVKSPGGFVLGLSSGVHRAAASRAAFEAGLTKPATLVDPTAVIARTADLGHGTYVNAGVVVGANTVIGCHANVNRSASVGHDNILAFASSLGPGAVTTGEVQVGPAGFVGAGATVLPGVRIGRRAVVGAGSVVTRDVPDFGVVAGNPAKVLRMLDETPEEFDRCPHC